MYVSHEQIGYNSNIIMTFTQTICPNPITPSGV